MNQTQQKHYYKVIYFDHNKDSKERYINFSDETFKTLEKAKELKKTIWNYSDLVLIVEITDILNTYKIIL